jgi:two-component system, NarL family, response regulator LiaR
VNAVRVLIVDDHPVVRQGLYTFLSLDADIEVVGEAANGEQAVTRAGELRPDLVLMDVLMPGMDGISAIRLILKEYPEIHVLVLTSADQDRMVLEAMEAGALGYLLKDAEVHDLRRAIRSTSSGERYISPRLAGRLINELNCRGKGTSLTGREEEILQLLAKGYSNKDIATALQIGLATVKTHVSTILGKLQVSSRTQAALLANGQGSHDGMSAPPGQDRAGGAIGTLRT